MNITQNDHESNHHEALLVLKSVYRDRAAEEALLRAVTAERANDRDGAVFWIEIFSAIIE
ncbi:MAG: hypothetical protein AB3N20_14490 [Rhizobiaceae bacterium]